MTNIRFVENTMQQTKLKVIPLRDPAEAELLPITDHPNYKPVAAEYASIAARLKKAEEREQVAKARLRGQAPTVSMQDRAKALISGGRVVSAPPAQELEAAREEIDILVRALSAKQEELNVIAGDISFEVCARFAAINADALRAALDAVTKLHEALYVGRLIKSRIWAAGYSVNDAALPTHIFERAWLIGDPDRVDGNPASMFKQWLIEKRIIK